MDKDLMQEVASLMKDPSKKEAFAEMMVEYVQPNHLMTDFVGLLLNTRSMKPGDMLVKKVRKGIRVHTFVPGAIPLSSQITVSDRINYVLDGAIVDVNYNSWDLAAGEIGTVESIRSEMSAKMRDYIMSKVFTALSTVWTAVNTPNNYTSVGGAVTKTALDNAIEYVNQNVAGGAKAIVGVRSAMHPIIDFAGYNSYSATDFQIESVREEIFRTGWLGRYQGVPLVTIDQQWDNPEDHVALMPTDKILVIGQNVGEFVTFGDTVSSSWEDPRPVPPQTYMRMYSQFGMIVDNAEGLFVLGNLS